MFQEICLKKNIPKNQSCDNCVQLALEDQGKVFEWNILWYKKRHPNKTHGYWSGTSSSMIRSGNLLLFLGFEWPSFAGLMRMLGINCSRTIGHLTLLTKFASTRESIHITKGWQPYDGCMVYIWSLGINRYVRTPWGKQMIFQGRSTSKAFQPWFAWTECDRQPSDLIMFYLADFQLLLDYKQRLDTI